MTEKRAKRKFTDQFKQQMVQLHNNGKPRAEIIREYDLTPSSLDNWIRRINATGSAKECDNRTPESTELLKLRKENQKLKMENDILKQAALILAQVIVIRQNAHKYSVSAMCKCLNIARSTYYYEDSVKPDESDLEEKVAKIFHDNHDVYGTRKIKKELKKIKFIVSRRKIGRIMKKLGLVSKYTVAQFKPHRQKCNEEPVKNELNREFNGQAPYAVVVSDLTYVRVNYKWNYVCILVDLFNREIIDYSAGIHKDAQFGLVMNPTSIRTAGTLLRRSTKKSPGSASWLMGAIKHNCS
jgi:putative transposase